MRLILIGVTMFLCAAGFAIGGPKQDRMHSILELQGRQMINTVAFISINPSYSASGVLIHSGKVPGFEAPANFVITNFHVIASLISNTDGVTIYAPAEVWTYRYGKGGKLSSSGTYIANIVAVDEELDLALLQLQGNSDILTNVAKIGRQPLRVLEKVYAVGAGLGSVPFPTLGIVSLVTSDSILASSPIITGNSGGGLFAFDYDLGRYVLAGVAKTVAGTTVYGDVEVPGFLNIGHKTVSTTTTVPVPHMGYFVPVAKMCQFLARNDYAYICLN